MGALTVLTNDGYQEVAPLLHDACCPQTLCEINLCCGFIGTFLNILPNGPLWDEPKARLFAKLETDCHGILKCAPCDPDACVTLVDVAMYEARRLYDLLLTALWPALREANPLTAITTMDDWLDRLGWRNCFDCACRQPGFMAPYEVLGPCGPVCCPAPLIPKELEDAVKHGIILSLVRLNMGIIKNVDNINWVIEPLGAKITPVARPCDDLNPDYGLQPGCLTSITQQGCPDPLFEICCATDDCTIDRAPIEGCVGCECTPAPLSACVFPREQQCGYITDGPEKFCPGVLAAECIVRTLLPEYCNQILNRCC